jgi:anthranilate 1,2-dioxygenase small subunit
MASLSSASFELRAQIEATLAEYMHTLASDRLEDWPNHFTPNGTYRVTTRENYDQNLPLCLMICEGHGMMHDRIIALRTANIFEPHVYCHIPGAMRITEETATSIRSESTFVVMRTMSDGTTSTFACGRTFDHFVKQNGELKIAERLVVLDSRQIDTLLVIPL